MTTPREQLAKLLDSHQPDIDDVAATITNCTCGELLNDIPYWQNPYTNHIADAIIQAGWTPQKEKLMTTPFFNNVPFPKITLGKAQSGNGVFRQEVTTDYSETVRAMNLELLTKTDEEILEYLIPHIQGALLKAGWTPPTPAHNTLTHN